MSTYEKKTWINNETKVNATNMNHIEEGIYENANDIEQIQHDMRNYENEISEVQEDVEQCEEDILELRNKVDRKVFMQNVSVSNWVADNTYADYGYRAEIANAKITSNSVVSVIYNVTEALSGNYAPVCQTIDGAIYIYSKVNTSITIPTIKEM